MTRSWTPQSRRKRKEKKVPALLLQMRWTVRRRIRTRQLSAPSRKRALLKRTRDQRRTRSILLANRILRLIMMIGRKSKGNGLRLLCAKGRGTIKSAREGRAIGRGVISVWWGGGQRVGPRCSSSSSGRCIEAALG